MVGQTIVERNPFIGFLYADVAGRKLFLNDGGSAAADGEPKVSSQFANRRSCRPQSTPHLRGNGLLS